MSKFWKKTVAILCVSLVFVATIIGIEKSFAREVEDDPNGSSSSSTEMVTDELIKKKSIYYALRQCYTNGDALKDSISLSSWSSGNIAQGDAEIFNKYGFEIPIGYVDGVNGGHNINCAYVNSSNIGITQILMQNATNGNKIGQVVTAKSDSRTEYYENMGYTASSSKQEEYDNADGQKCVSIKFTVNGYSGQSNEICMTITDGVVSDITEGNATSKAAGNINVSIASRLDQKIIGNDYDNISNNGYYFVNKISIYYTGEYPPSQDIYFGVCTENQYNECGYDDGTQLKLQMESVIDTINNHEMDINISSDSNGVQKLPQSFSAEPAFRNVNKNGTSKKIEMDTYTMELNGQQAYAKAYQYLENDKASIANSQFDNTELYYIYSNALNDGFNLGILYATCSDSNLGDGYIKVITAGADNVHKIQYCIDDEYSNIVPQNSRAKISLYENGTFTLYSKTYKEIVEIINNLDGINASRLPANSIQASSAGSTDGTSGSSGSGTSAEPSCYTTDLAGMGWIACPVEQNLENFTDWIMAIIDDWLSIDTKYYGADSATYNAWTYAQGMANVLVVIFMLFVIVSQITGYGIDNYGIKKILPKIIVVAVLINLSFIICELAIDASNALGNGLDEFFKNIAINVAGGNETALGVQIGDIAAGIIALVAGAGAASAGVIEGVTLLNGDGTSGSAGPVIILVIIALLIALVAILMFFVTIAARIIIIIMCTVLAPLAFACYALPNTKKLFTKWWDLFKAALVVYPICGGLRGISFIIRAIIYKDGNVEIMMALVGTVASVIPYLVLPSLLKKALSGLGVVGEKISGLGQSLQKGLRRGQETMRKTDAYQQRMAAGKNQLTERGIRNAQRRLQRREERNVNFAGNEGAELRQLRDKQLKGTIDDAGKARLDELEKKYSDDLGRYYKNERRNDNATASASRNNTYLSQRANERDNANYGRLSSHASGVDEENKFKNSEAHKGISDWNKQFDTATIDEGGENIKMVRQADGSWVGMNSKNEVVRKTAADMQGVIPDGKVTKAQLSAAQGELKRSEEMGGLSAYGAFMDNNGVVNSGLVQAAGVAAGQKAVGSLADTMVNGTDDVLKIQRQKSNEQRRQTVIEGDVGYEEKTDEVLRQAAEAQKIAIKSANAAAPETVMTEQQIEEAVAAGKNKLINQFTENTEQNAAGVELTDREVARINAQNTRKLANAKNHPELVSEMTQYYADALEKERFNTAQRKMYGEELKNLTRDDAIHQLEANMSDENYVNAAMDDVINKGGYEDLNRFFMKHVNATGTPPNISKAMTRKMATLSQDPIMKAYGKYAEGSTTPVPYKTWLTQADNLTADPDGKQSLAGFMRVNGEMALENASKDIFKFATPSNALLANADERKIMRAIAPEQILHGAAKARDNETRRSANQLLESKFKMSATPTADRAATIAKSTASEFTNMDISTLNVLIDKDIASVSTAADLDPGIVTSLGNVAQSIRKAGGAAKANIKPEVADFLRRIGYPVN